MSTQQPNKIPTEVKLNLSYYQRDKSTKRLVSATIEYSGFIDPTNYPTAKEFNYTLILNYLPMGHTALAIAFALPSSVYMVMYIIVGALAIVMTAVFALYHRLVSRSKDKQIYFLPYLQYAVPPNLIGLAYSLIPVGIYIFFLALFVTGHILTWRINSLFCQSGNEECLATSMFDYIAVSPYKDTAERKLIQRRRFGYFLVHTGLWLLWRQAQLSTVKDAARDAKRKEFTAHDNNIWTPTTVKRLHYFMISLLTIMLDIFLIRTSFTQIMSANIWLFVYSFKILGIAVEAISEYILQDNLLLLPISSTLGLMEGLATIAAPDFFEFVYGFIQGLGIQFVERAYWDPVKDMAVDWIIEKYEELQEWFKKIMGEAKEAVKDQDEEEAGGDAEIDKDGQKDDKADGDDDSKSKRKDDEAANASGADKDPKEDSDNGEAEKDAVDSEGSEILLTEESDEMEGMDDYESKMLGVQNKRKLAGAAAESKAPPKPNLPGSRLASRKKSNIRKKTATNSKEGVQPKEIEELAKNEEKYDFDNQDRWMIDSS